LARQLHGDQPEAAEQLRQTTREARDRRLRDKIRYSQRVMAERGGDFVEQFEEGIADDLESMRRGIADAVGAMGEPTERQQGRALDQARDVARALESLGDRARESMDGDSAAGASSRQLRSELRRRAGELRGLAEEFERQGMEGNPLGDVARRLGRMDASGAIGTPRGLDDLAELVAALKDYEFALRRQLLDDEAAPSVLSAGEDVPPQYRELVEEYYRRLAERRR
jgi:hypothetical protein